MQSLASLMEAIFTAVDMVQLPRCRLVDIELQMRGQESRGVRGTCDGFDRTGHRGEIVDVARRLQPDVCSKSTAHCPGIS